MTRCYSRAAVACLALALAGVLSVHAQELRPAGSMYLNPRLGLALYGGDRDRNQDNTVGELFSQPGEAMGLEAGYRFRTALAAGAYYLAGRYPRIDGQDVALEPLDPATTSAWRHSVGLVGTLYFFPGSPITPTMTFGGGTAFGKVNDEWRFVVGPIFGLGLDVMLLPNVGVYLTSSGAFTFPDGALDGSSSPLTEDIDTDYDFLGFVGGGVRFTMGRALPPVNVLSFECPAECLQVNEPGIFTTAVNDDVAGPVEVQWNFGDGGVAAGANATHSFVRPGTYLVTLAAASRSTVTRQCTVVVNALAVNALTANPPRVNACATSTPIQFTSSVMSSSPVSYHWDFGDGTTSTQANPAHRFVQPGVYTVTLEATNQCGRESRSITVNIEPCEVDYCAELTELNAVYFGSGDKKGGTQGATALTDEGRLSLDENLQLLRDCPNTCVRVAGYADPDERDPARLAEQRARAVERYYVENGVAASRLLVVTGGTGGDGNLQRADSVPVDCGVLGGGGPR